MNYRHAYHAGNFADVLKHAVLALVIEHLKRKDTPFRLIDTHAGVGLYDLTADEAERTGEWREGIGRLWGEGAPPLPAEAALALAPLLDTLAKLNPDGRLTRYPGSPALGAALLRRHDRLTVSELHPEDGERLRALLGPDRRAKVIAPLDGWLALGAFVPPKERRGLVLVDPPFEVPGDFGRLADGYLKAIRRWPTGTYLLWYPAKDEAAVSRFLAHIAESSEPKALRAELWVRAPHAGSALGGAGLVIANPPYTLEAVLRSLGSFLAERLAQGVGASFRLDWVVAKRAR